MWVHVETADDSHRLSDGRENWLWPKHEPSVKHENKWALNLFEARWKLWLEKHFLQSKCDITQQWHDNKVDRIHVLADFNLFSSWAETETYSFGIQSVPFSLCFHFALLINVRQLLILAQYQFSLLALPFIYPFPLGRLFWVSWGRGENLPLGHEMPLDCRYVITHSCLLAVLSQKVTGVHKHPRCCRQRLAMALRIEEDLWEDDISAKSAQFS